MRFPFLKEPSLIILLGIALVFLPLLLFRWENSFSSLFGVVLIFSGLILKVTTINTKPHEENLPTNSFSKWISFLETLLVVGVVIWPGALLAVALGDTSGAHIPSDVVFYLVGYAEPLAFVCLVIAYVFQKRIPFVAFCALVIPFINLTAAIILLYF